MFRDLVAFEPSAIEQDPLVEDLLEIILGDSFYLGTAHSSVVHQGGGLQDLHQDQGYVPLPHPPYPLTVLIIHTYTSFSLEEGATYIVPGSHRDAAGENLVRDDADYENLAKGKLLALTVPSGSSMLMDARVLHSGGERTTPGTRLATRILYQRAFIRQQENQLAGMKALIGFRTHQTLSVVVGDMIAPNKPRIPVGELSMERPEEFEQDFDWRYSRIA